MDWSLTLTGEQAFGVILSENGLLVAILTISVTKWMSNYQEQDVLIVSSIIYGMSMVTFGLSGSIWIFIIAMAFFTFAELMTAGIQQTFVSKIASDHMCGQYFAGKFTTHNWQDTCTDRNTNVTLVRLPAHIFYTRRTSCI